ncbi:conjugal transfer protein TrbE [Bradyrhizobium sp. AUGA SZCCT0274]|uniref:conjugal transfer protein TrbE n=1 Tax=Bradyrhizobium sp. AUGA SZCCT0274 TaxID=2807670 RepID=UPI001BAA83E2|nr:conjugal transfer protein TrbE [Bradyrhizobium sp. AUGA SZCCT0274]MBR1243516.1 conjugal transfer protein TrbE [Bradyrhizobium sp. AUGA SZCCT0274]
MLNLREFRSGASKLADWLPWACLVGPGIVLNKDGSFQRTIRYRGPDLDSATEAELMSVTSRVNNVLKRFGAGWALFFDATRVPASSYPRSQFPDAVSSLVDEERRASFEGTTEALAWDDPARPRGEHLESISYLTLMYLPPAERVSRFEGLFFESSADAGSARRASSFWRRRADRLRTGDEGGTEKDIANEPQQDAQTRGARGGYREHLDRFVQETDRAIDLLASVLPEIASLDDAATLTYLHSCISTKRHQVGVPNVPAYLDAFLCDEPLTAGLSPALGRSHLRTLTVLGFPAVTFPGVLDDLNRLGVAYRWATRFLPLDRNQANAVLSRYRRQWFAKRKSLGAILKEVMFNEQAALLDTDADNKALDADSALQELGDDLVAFGYVTTTVTVCDEDSHAADEKIRAVERAINTRGFTTIRESVNAVEAWLGSLPGQAYANIRQPIVHTLNLAHMCPLSAVWAGPARCEQLDGPPLLIAKTKGATPFRLSLHVGDVGHTLIVGPTGAGKSVLLSILALQFRRYPNAQLINFDKGRSARAATTALGGAWYQLGVKGGLSFQPLRNVDDEGARLWALDWLCGVLAHERVTITPEVKETLWSALRSLGSAPVKQRTMTGFVALLARDALRQALAPYTLEGPYGRFLDADTDALSTADTLTFEMEELMALPGLVAPVLTYLFHALEARFDGRPTLLILDEAWVFLDDPLFAGRIREWLKTLRKKNVAVIFATQSLADIADSAIAPAIAESCPTRIFLPNPRALEQGQAETYRRFGLNDAQIRLVAEAFPKRDYYLQSRAGNRLFELGLGPVALAFAAAASPEDQRVIESLLARFGPEQFAERYLRECDLGWAANLLSTFEHTRRS